MADRLLALLASLMSVPQSALDERSGRGSVEKWDSMREVLLASMLENEFGIELSVAEMEQLHSVADIREILHKHGVAT